MVISNSVLIEYGWAACTVQVQLPLAYSKTYSTNATMYAQTVTTYYQMTVYQQDKATFTASINAGNSGYQYRWTTIGY